MSPQETRAANGREHSGPQQTPRLWLKRKGPTSGYVDGAWWPHSNDLPAELPDLLAVLSVRLGNIARVIYSLDEWDSAPRKVSIDGRIVRLGGFHYQPANTVGIIDDNGHQLLLLVVPVDTDAERAHDIVMAAVEPDDARSVKTLLAV